MTQKISIASVNFQLSEEIRTELRDLVGPLFKAAIPVCSIKLTLQGDYTRRNTIHYTAHILLALRSSEIVASTESGQLRVAVQRVIEQAQTQLEERARQKSGNHAA